MKKIITISVAVIIVIGVIFAIMTKKESKYDALFDRILEKINENGQYINEDLPSGIKYETDGFFSLGSSQNFDDSFGTHFYTISEDVNDEKFDKHHKIVEEYTFSNDIVGVITEDSVGRTHSFFQTNGAEGEPQLYITFGRDKSIDDMKKYLDEFELPEEKNWTIDDLETHLDMNLKDVYALNIDDKEVEKIVVNMEFNNNGGITFEYFGMEVDGNEYIVVLAIDRKNLLAAEGVNEFETKEGKVVSDIIGNEKQFIWSENGYVYSLGVTGMNGDMLSKEKIFQLIDDTDVQLKK